MEPTTQTWINSEIITSAGTALLGLFDHIGGVQCWIKDRAGVYQWVNQAFLFNYSKEGHWESVVGKTDYDLSPAHLAEQFRMDDGYVLKGVLIRDRLELVGRYDHVSTWNRTTKLPIIGTTGSVLGTAGITRPAELVEDAVGVHADAALGKALDYIRRHHADTLSNQTLAAMTGKSVRALERLFVRELGLTPQQYLRRVRVRLSCHDLINTRWGLREVALRHGFYDQSHFSREFRKETSMTPKAYRLQFGSSGIVLGSKGVPL